MTGLTNIYINHILNRTCTKFRGVFSCDNINESILNYSQSSFVCNLSAESSLGSHFVTIIVQKSRILYLDSLGMSCTNPDIINFIIRFEKPIFYNVTQIQSYSSIFCGFYSIYFCLHYDKYNHDDYAFSNILHDNDDACIQLIKRKIQSLK